MHEAKVAEYVFDLVMEIVDDDNDLKGKKIKSLSFALTEPHSVIPDSFEFYFTELVKGTLIEGAKLEFSDNEELELGAFYLSGIEVDE
jgi:Zn finger protein HypA/HybF involved in hydrogenase expression